MRFASPEWIAALVRAVNVHPDLRRAVAGLGADVAAIVEADPLLDETVAAWGRHEGGRVVEWRLLEDEDEVLELRPAYEIRAPCATWRDLIAGKVDPVRAALSGQVRVKGDLEALVRRASYRYILDGALRGIETEFPGEAKR